MKVRRKSYLRYKASKNAEKNVKDKVKTAREARGKASVAAAKNERSQKIERGRKAEMRQQKLRTEEITKKQDKIKAEKASKKSKKDALEEAGTKQRVKREKASKAAHERYLKKRKLLDDIKKEKIMKQLAQRDKLEAAKAKKKEMSVKGKEKVKKRKYEPMHKAAARNKILSKKAKERDTKHKERSKKKNTLRKQKAYKKFQSKCNPANHRQRRAIVAGHKAKVQPRKKEYKPLPSKIVLQRAAAAITETARRITRARQLQAKVLKGIKATKAAASALAAKMPRLTSITTGDISLEYFLDPQGARKDIRVPPMKICFTEVGCATLKRAPSAADLSRTIRRVAKRQMVRWLKRHLKMETTSFKLASSAMPYQMAVASCVATYEQAMVDTAPADALWKAKRATPVGLATQTLNVQFPVDSDAHALRKFARQPRERVPTGEVAKHLEKRKRLGIAKVTKEVTRPMGRKKVRHEFRTVIAGPEIYKEKQQKAKAKPRKKAATVQDAVLVPDSTTFKTAKASKIMGCGKQGTMPAGAPPTVNHKAVLRVSKANPAILKNVIALKAYAVAAHKSIVFRHKSKISAVASLVHRFGAPAPAKGRKAFNVLTEYLGMEAQYTKFYCSGLAKYLVRKFARSMRRRGGVLTWSKSDGGKAVVTLNLDALGLANAARMKAWSVTQAAFNQMPSQLVASGKPHTMVGTATSTKVGTAVSTKATSFAADGCHCIKASKHFGACKKHFSYDKTPWCIVNTECKRAKKSRVGSWASCA